MVKTNKLVVVGTGHVGSYVLADAMKLGLFAEIGLIDVLEDTAYGEAVDQMHARAHLHLTNTEVTNGGYEQCKDADIIVICPSHLRPEESVLEDYIDRTVAAELNGKIVRDIMGKIVKQTSSAIIICITNPLDTITYIAENEFSYPKGKIFGTGTMLETARLKHIISKIYSIDPKSVTGLVLGEHGVSAVPILSRLNVLGIPYTELPVHFEGNRKLPSPEEISREIDQETNEVYLKKGWTNAGIAAVTAALMKSILLDEKSIYPVSVTLRGEYGYDGDTAVSIPCVVGKEGIEKRLVLPLDKWEEKKFHESAEYVQGVLRQAGALSQS